MATFLFGAGIIGLLYTFGSLAMKEGVSWFPEDTWR